MNWRSVGAQAVVRNVTTFATILPARPVILVAAKVAKMPCAIKAGYHVGIPPVRTVATIPVPNIVAMILGGMPPTDLLNTLSVPFVAAKLGAVAIMETTTN